MHKHPLLSPERVEAFTKELFADDLHAKRVRSLADATLGALHASAIGVHAIGQGLATARGLVDKHAIKQVDRMLGNTAIDPWKLADTWVPFVIGDRQEVFANLDWTEFESADHSTIVLAMQTDHGRATPLLWQTVRRSELGDQQHDHEDRLLQRFRDVVPPGVRVTIVADRGFADQKLYRYLRDHLGFEFIIRIRSSIHVTDAKGTTRPARAWVAPGGRMRVLRGAFVTGDKQPIPTIVCLHDAAMADAWYIVASDPFAGGRALVERYGKRFSIEEMFRDIKDIRFGMGLGWREVRDPPRRDRLLLVAALAQALLTLLGQAGENAGLDKLLRASFKPRRAYSLFRQGFMWYERIPNMPEGRLRTLMGAFEAVVRQHPVFKQAFGYE